MKEFLDQVDQYNLADIVEYHGFVSYEKIINAISDIDVGVIPNELNPFTQINLPVRIFEYLSQHRPVIVPRTQGIMDYFDEDSLFFFEPNNDEDLTKVILKIYCNPSGCQPIIKRGLDVYSQYRWELQRRDFINSVTRLVENHSSQLGR